jgi:hypothetical protein
MSSKYVLSSLGCAVAWLVLLPALLFIGGVTLTVYAVFTELSALFTHRAYDAIDNSTARKLAHRLCVGH